MGHKWKGLVWKQLLLYVAQTCDSPAVFLIGVSGLFHPGEDLFAHRELGVLLFWPPRERALKRLHLCGGLMGAPKPADIPQRPAEEVVVLDVLCRSGFLHFHEMCTGAPPLTFWRSAGSQMSHGRFPESPGLLAWEDPEKKKKTGDRIREETTWSILSPQ